MPRVVERELASILDAYVYNIPTNETVNLRKAANSNGTVLIRVGYGKAVSASPSSTTGWHGASYGGYTGYIMSKFLTADNPSGGTGGESFSYPISATIDTVKNGVGGTVNLRNAAATTGTVIATIPNKSAVKVERLSGTWLPTKFNTKTGYLMGKFVVGADEYSGGSTGGGSSGGETGNYTISAMVETDRYGNGLSLTMRASQSTNSDSIAKIAAGTKIFVSTLSGEWLPAKYVENKRSGYMKSIMHSSRTD